MSSTHRCWDNICIFAFQISGSGRIFYTLSLRWCIATTNFLQGPVPAFSAISLLLPSCYPNPCELRNKGPSSSPSAAAFAQSRRGTLRSSFRDSQTWPASLLSVPNLRKLKKKNLATQALHCQHTRKSKGNRVQNSFLLALVRRNALVEILDFLLAVADASENGITFGHCFCKCL